MFSTSAEKAYLGPFVVFLLCFAAGEMASHLWEGQAAWWFSASRYWVYPLQTAVSGALLWRWWRFYRWGRPGGWGWALAAGVLVLLIWIAPVAWLGQPPRTDGFDPAFFGQGWPEWLNLSVRFLRLVVVVPLVEEIFWRGFLMRALIDGDFERVPIGTFHWPAFLITTAGFTLEHQMADWPAAALAGAIYNLVAIKTGSLRACVAAHAITNGLLGLYILRTAQWGFW